MKKRIFLMAGIIVIGLASTLSFKLFEPVFTHNVGWATLPPMPRAMGETLDDRWMEQGCVANTTLAAGLKSTNASAISAALSIDGNLTWRGGAGLADVKALEPANEPLNLKPSDEHNHSISEGQICARYFDDGHVAHSTPKVGSNGHRSPPSLFPACLNT
jgi:hypothetical protein